MAGAEWDEVRRLDLTTKVLRMEGELGIRNDSNKKTAVLVGAFLVTRWARST